MLLLPSVGDKTRKGRVDKTGLIRGVMGVFGSGFGDTEDVRPLAFSKEFLREWGRYGSETRQHSDIQILVIPWPPIVKIHCKETEADG